MKCGRRVLSDKGGSGEMQDREFLEFKLLFELDVLINKLNSGIFIELTVRLLGREVLEWELWLTSLNGGIFEDDSTQDVDNLTLSCEESFKEV